MRLCVKNRTTNEVYLTSSVVLFIWVIIYDKSEFSCFGNTFYGDSYGYGCANHGVVAHA